MEHSPGKEGNERKHHVGRVVAQDQGEWGVGRRGDQLEH